MNKWSMTSLARVAKPVSRPIQVEMGKSYRTIGVKWWGEGAYERQTIDGSETAAKSLSLVRRGDLIINKIWVRHGSTAIATEAVDGCAASNEFPTFELDQEQVHPGWVHWLTKTKWFWAECDALSMGTSGKNRIKPEKFLTISIPLPPLSEQQRLVERIEILAAKIDEAKRLRTEADEGIEALCRSVLHSDPAGGITLMRMSELVTQRDPDVTVQSEGTYHFAGVYCFGRGVFVGQRKSGMEFQYPRLTTLRTDDFVYPKLMAWEGALATVPPECNGLVVSTEFPVFEVNTDRVLPEVLDVHFRTPEVWPALSGTSTGTNMRRRRLNPADFLRYQFPLPSMATQQRVKAIREKVGTTASIRVDQIQELEAMFPAILDRAFKGEL